MDGENHQTSRSGSNGLPTGEAAMLRPADSQGGSSVVYCGDATRVREGFTIALALLGLGAGMMVDGITRDQSGDGE